MCLALNSPTYNNRSGQLRVLQVTTNWHTAPVLLGSGPSRPCGQINGPENGVFQRCETWGVYKPLKLLQTLVYLCMFHINKHMCLRLKWQQDRSEAGSLSKTRFRQKRAFQEKLNAVKKPAHMNRLMTPVINSPMDVTFEA